MRTSIVALATALCLCSALAACGGGGGGGAVPTTPAPTTTPTSTPTVAPSPSATPATTTLSNGTNTVAFPASNGVSASLSLSGSLGGVQTTVSAITSGAPAPQYKRMSSAPTIVAAWKITFSGSVQTIDLSSDPSFSVNGISSAMAALYAEMFDSSIPNLPPNWMTYDATTNSFVGANQKLALGDTYYLEIVSGSSGPPTPTPTATPTATPSAIQLSPTSLSFLDTSSTDTQTVSVSEAGYAGAFTVPTSCTNNGTTIATIAAGTAADTYTVTPTAAGNCTAIVSDALGNSTALAITVTTTTIGGQ